MLTPAAEPFQKHLTFVLFFAYPVKVKFVNLRPIKVYRQRVCGKLVRVSQTNQQAGVAGCNLAVLRCTMGAHWPAGAFHIRLLACGKLVRVSQTNQQAGVAGCNLAVLRCTMGAHWLVGDFCIRTKANYINKNIFRISMVKEIYATYKKRHDLPSFAEMDNEFELSAIDTPDFFLRQVKRKMKEKLQELSELFSEILNPSSDSLVQLLECRIFDTAEKDKIYELFREIQYCLNALQESEYINKDKQDAELINAVYKNWKNIKTKSLLYIKKLKESWKKEIKLKEALEYFG